MIYLDPDILVLNPLRPLWELELGGNLFAAAAHTGKTELANNVNRLRLGTRHDYYNSGVLLMDLEACRARVVPEILFRYVREHGKEMLLPDQDLLNVLYGEEILPLQDVMSLPASARMNTPGTVGSPNWEWRISDFAAAGAALMALKPEIQKRGRL